MITLDTISGDGVFLAGDYLIYPTFEAVSSSGSRRVAKRLIAWGQNISADLYLKPKANF